MHSMCRNWDGMEERTEGVGEGEREGGRKEKFYKPAEKCISLKG